MTRKASFAKRVSGKLDVVVVDRAGTLTMGQPQVVQVVAAEGLDQDGVPRVPATVEQGFDHPLAQAIRRRAAGQQLARFADFANIEGKGAGAEVDVARAFWRSVD